MNKNMQHLRTKVSFLKAIVGRFTETVRDCMGIHAHLYMHVVIMTSSVKNRDLLLTRISDNSNFLSIPQRFEFSRFYCIHVGVEAVHSSIGEYHFMALMVN